MGELTIGADTQGEFGRGEAALARRLAQADPAACAELCERFGLKIRQYASVRLAGDVQLAEDVMVQTLASAVRCIGEYRPGRATLSAWVYGIAWREVQRELRVQSRLKSVPRAAQIPLDAIAELAHESDLAADTLARLEARRQVGRLVAVLSEVELEVLVLSAIGDLSAQEIARIIGRSTRAVHSLLHRAKQKARESLTCNER